ncbi:ABC transporter permease [Candidatus Atribacteria bacterium HGW-Atribacteria-1]|nr:MAG: ABC transporter permease [Candidatus Atribacteria bacterium HGW-Atribacteria-1]
MGIFFFYYCFAGWNFFISLTDWKGFIPSYNLVGFKNYVNLFHDPIFWISLKNNLLLILGFVPGVIFIGLILAILIDQKIRGEGFFRTIYLVPFGLSFVVTATLWTWMYSPKIGTINVLLEKFRLGFLKSGWITDPTIVMYCIIIALIWQFVGYSGIIFLAGIRSIPESQIAAAKVDGAYTFTLYRRIVLPQLKASFITAFIIFMCFALKAFDFIWVLNRGGPGYSSHILGVTMYKETFMLDKYAYGAAYSTIILVLSLVIVIPFLYRVYRRE